MRPLLKHRPAARAAHSCSPFYNRRSILWDSFQIYLLWGLARRIYIVGLVPDFLLWGLARRIDFDNAAERSEASEAAQRTHSDGHRPVQHC